ncbi:MAG: cytochrome c [Planctomycetaceae bacterium]
MKSVKVAVAVLFAVIICGLVSSSVTDAFAQVKSGKTRPASTKYLMRGVVKPHCGDLGAMLKEGPKDDEAWDAAACHAACLSEMSYTLMDDGRCPDAVWAMAAGTTLREGSAALLAAAEAKDLEAANAAFKTVTASCAACHKEHKK